MFPLFFAAWTPTTRAQQKFPADMPAEYQGVAKAELPRNQSYCEHHDILSQVLDCGCFAKTVLRYRAAHFKDNQTHPDPTGWESLPSLLNGEKLNCSECTSANGLSKWTAEQTHLRLLLRTAKNPAELTPSVEKGIKICVAKSVARTFREKPFASLLPTQCDQAFFTCQKQYLP